MVVTLDALHQTRKTRLFPGACILVHKVTSHFLGKYIVNSVKNRAKPVSPLKHAQLSHMNTFSRDTTVKCLSRHKLSSASIGMQIPIVHLEICQFQHKICQVWVTRVFLRIHRPIQTPRYFCQNSHKMAIPSVTQMQTTEIWLESVANDVGNQIQLRPRSSVLYSCTEFSSTHRQCPIHIFDATERYTNVIPENLTAKCSKWRGQSDPVASRVFRIVQPRCI